MVHRQRCSSAIGVREVLGGDDDVVNLLERNAAYPQSDDAPTLPLHDVTRSVEDECTVFHCTGETEQAAQRKCTSTTLVSGGQGIRMKTMARRSLQPHPRPRGRPTTARRRTSRA